MTFTLLYQTSPPLERKTVTTGEYHRLRLIAGVMLRKPRDAEEWAAAWIVDDENEIVFYELRKPENENHLYRL